MRQLSTYSAQALDKFANMILLNLCVILLEVIEKQLKLLITKFTFAVVANIKYCFVYQVLDIRVD